MFPGAGSLGHTTEMEELPNGWALGEELSKKTDLLLISEGKNFIKASIVLRRMGFKILVLGINQIF